MGNFDETDLQKAYAWAQGNYNETVTIARRSRQMGRKLQAWTKTAYPTGLNIAPSEDPSIAPGITKEASEEYDASLLGRSSLDIEPIGDDISLFSDYASLGGGYVYPHEDKSLGFSTATGPTSVSKVKKATSLLTQELNANLKKER